MEDDGSPARSSEASSEVEEQEALTPDAQLERLNSVEQNIARVLHLASTAMSLLTMPGPAKENEEISPDEHLELDSEERERMFNRTVKEYFSLLNKVQMTIRSTLGTLRLQRVSPALLMESTGKEPPTYGASLPQPTDEEVAEGDVPLGVYEKRMLRDSWVNVAEAMETMRRARETPSSPVPANGDVESMETE